MAVLKILINLASTIAGVIFISKFNINLSIGIGILLGGKLLTSVISYIEAVLYTRRMTKFLKQLENDAPNLELV